MAMSSAIVYRTENVVNGKFYYGVMSENNCKASTYLGSGKLLKRAIDKYGRDKFVRRTIAKFATVDEAYDFEALVVDQDFVDRDDCYNIKLGGIGSTGLKWSEEQKKIKKVQNSGESNPFYGKTHSKESIELMRRNKKNVSVEIEGVTYYSLAEASRVTGIPISTIKYRKDRGIYTMKDLKGGKQPKDDNKDE